MVVQRCPRRSTLHRIAHHQRLFDRRHRRGIEWRGVLQIGHELGRRLAGRRVVAGVSEAACATLIPC